MRNIFTLPALLSISILNAQPFAIGNAERTFYDAARDRDVPCEIHYPAVAAGDEQPLAAGSFPVLVIGHGFVMTVDAYVYLWEHFVPLGYIVILPSTEGGFAPDHADFGADLAFLSAQMTNENADGASIFFGHVAPGRALAGHSMGGGAALLGAAGNSSITAVMVLAPAETSPSAIAAAQDVVVPTLVFAADEDCVTPIATNQQPMYDALNVPCKALVNVLGGGHCYFGNDNFLCSFGELTCAPDLSITREEQHDVVLDLGTLWLDHWFSGDAAALAQFEDSLDISARITSQRTCLSTQVSEIQSQPCSVIQDHGSQSVTLSCPQARVLGALDMLGRFHNVAYTNGTGASLSMHELPVGVNVLIIDSGNGSLQRLPIAVVR